MKFLAALAFLVTRTGQRRNTKSSAASAIFRTATFAYCAALAFVLGAGAAHGQAVLGVMPAQQSWHSKNRPSVLIGDVQPLLPKSATDGSLINGLPPRRLDVFPQTPLHPPPPAKVVITFDEGGMLTDYDVRWRAVRARGNEVEIRGLCQSACTLVTGHISKDRLCFSEYARLNFHQARQAYSREIAIESTRWMYNNYPTDIRDWIEARGGVKRIPAEGFWTLTAKELWEMGYKRCSN